MKTSGSNGRGKQDEGEPFVVIVHLTDPLPLVNEEGKALGMIAFLQPSLKAALDFAKKAAAQPVFYQYGDKEGLLVPLHRIDFVQIQPANEPEVSTVTPMGPERRLPSDLPKIAIARN